MKGILKVAFVCLFSVGCNPQNSNNAEKINQDEVIEKYLKNGAWNHHYLTKEWDEWINKGLQEDSTIAYMWQQKAIPFWKRKKYSQAISYYDRAVKLDPQKWLSRLAFLKCVFAKDYKDALHDLITYKNKFGSTLEQDHSLEFYMGICYLQLNQYESALVVLKENVESQEKEYGVDWVHFLDRYYLAVTYYELDDYKNALSELDAVLKEYPAFSDAKYYKSLTLNTIGKKEEARALMAEGKINYEEGNTFTEDSSLYEVYPYQITWQWRVSESVLN